MNTPAWQENISAKKQVFNKISAYKGLTFASLFHLLRLRESLHLCDFETSTVSLPITSISSQQILILSLVPHIPQYFGLP